MSPDCQNTKLSLTYFVENLPVPAICISDEQVYFNHAAEMLTGYSRDELATLDQWFNKLYGPEHLTIRSFYEADREAGFPKTRDVAITRKDGSSRIVEFVGSGKNPTIYIMNDVTKRRQTETALRESEELWKFAFEGSGDGVWDWNIQKNTGRFSRRYVDMLGYSQEEFTHHPDAWVKRVHPEDLPFVLEEHQRHFRGETRSMTIEYRLLCKDGNYKWILGRGKVVARDPDGKPLRMVGTHTDITAQKTLEVTLKDSLERFRNLLENVETVAVQGYGADGTIHYWNRANERIYGYTPQEAIGKNLIDLVIPPEMRDEFRAAIKEGAATGIMPAAGELLLVSKDGSRVPVFSSHAAVCVPGHEPELFCIDMDLRDYKKTEQALKDSEEKYRLLIENATEGIVVCQGDHFRFVNPQAAKICGYTAKELLAKPFKELIHPADRPKAWERYQSRLLGKEIPPTLEIRIITADGQIRWLLINSVLIDWDGAPATLDFFTDITEQKEIEEALRFSETKFARIFQAAPVLLTISDLNNGMYLDVNDKFLEVSGYSRTEVIGKTSVELGWISAAARDSLIRELTRDGKVSNIELTMRAKDSSPVHCIFSGEVLHLNGQQRLLAIAQDITARKRIEETLQNFNRELELRVNERTAQLESALRHQESFSYTISHDLRAPLRAVEGYSRIIMEECADRLTPKANNYLNRMSNNVCRMGKLIDDLLGFSRLTRQPIQRKRADTFALVKEVCAELTSGRDMTKIRLTVARLPHCQADPGLLRQVFANLVDNALKFTATRDLATIEVGSFPQGKTTVFYVRDNGVGFDMQYAEMLFGVFQRLHGMEEFEGSGVGLAIAQNIIDRHGGSIWAESVPDGGAAFFFTLAAGREIPPAYLPKR